MNSKWSGRFTDGATARSDEVEVRFTPLGLEIRGSGASSRRTFTYDALTAASPLSPSSQDVLLTFKDLAGATLFVSAPDFVAELAERVPGLTARAQRWRTLKPILAVSAALIMVVASVWALDLSPAKSMARMMPDKMRENLGQSVVSSMVGKRRECKSPAGRRALDKLVARLTTASASKRSFKVRVFEWKLINAFATPGEQIILTSEVITKAAGPDEVAGVLAHEMGHGIELHPESGLVRTIGLTAALELFIGGGAISNLGLTLAQIQYTRAGEREADLHALRILKAGGISTDGLVRFFNRLGAKEKSGKGGPRLSMLRTHPVSDERARLAAAQSGYPVTPALSGSDWRALRTICGR